MPRTQELSSVCSKKQNQAWWCTPVISGLGKWVLKDQELKVIFDYKESFRPGWYRRPVSNKQNEQTNKQTRPSMKTQLPKESNGSQCRRLLILK